MSLAYHLSTLAVILLASVASICLASPAPQNRPDSVAGGLAAMKSFLLAEPCPSPFEAWGGLCLAFRNHSLTWRVSEALCVALGGHLVWVESRIEHNVIRGFVLSKGRTGYFWTGLYRASNVSDLSWSNGFRGSYRGKPFTEQELPFISADSRDHQFDGDGVLTQLPFVCRRRTRKDGQKANLMMILEHNRIEIEDQVRVIGIVTMKKMEDSIAKLAVAINTIVVECPPPWVRVEGMCLLYIFQLRTWPEAEDLCTVQGGTLFWFDNDKEITLVRSFSWTPHKRIYRYFWIGLHKGNSGKLIFTGHHTLAKELSENSSGKYMAVDKETSNFYFGDDSNKFSAVCRRLISK